ncbi:hypothetical protein [Amycolatopsis sp. cmx-4-68]|uniref:hypothetical protein n=1 Tax=Amycolatopsis sp. cmx-4-68 TaxID=2790938 RepID=UPI0039783FFD
MAEQKVMRLPPGASEPVIVERRSSGPRLVACFATMYYSALRPEEAVMLRDVDLELPRKGWGRLLVSETAPRAGAAWTDSGQRRDRRQLKLPSDCPAATTLRSPRRELRDHHPGLERCRIEERGALRSRRR